MSVTKVKQASRQYRPWIGSLSRAGGVPRGRSSAPPWGFAVPAILIFGVFILIPTLLNFAFPFTNWSGYKSSIEFTGLDTFAGIASDGTLWRGLWITLIYAVLAASFTNVFGLALALLLERDSRVNRVMRTVFFLPVLISALATGYIFQALLAPSGAVNGTLSVVFGHEVQVPWLSSPDWTLVVLCLIHSWKWMGLCMLIYLAGLKTIPHDVIEAAMIDGASKVQLFTRIRWPLLAPAVTFNVASGLIGSLNAFDIVLATTDGGPASSTQVVPIYIYQVFGQGLYAQAAAMNFVLFLVAVVLAVPLIIFLRRRERVL